MSSVQIVAAATDGMVVTDLGGTLYGLNAKLGSDRMRMVVGRFAPGEGLRLHRHDHTEELYYVIEGSCRVRAGAEVLEVSADSALRIPPGTPHALFNHTDMPCALLFVLAPPDQDIVLLADEVVPL